MNLTPIKESCCGCGACKEACPKNAIEMKPDEYGFVYPVIDNEKCVDCGICLNTCALKNSELKNSPRKCFAGVTKVTDIKKSSSGGVFGAIAATVLENGGAVFGASLDCQSMKAKHIKVTKKEDLYKILGSKYVQSDTSGIFSKVKEALIAGENVLFSGTPCQCDALYSYLKKDYENLLTVDILCHGVPNGEFFRGYIKLLQKNAKQKIKSFDFRSKKNGWQYKTAKIAFEKKEKYIFSNESSYLNLFESGVSVRESCYKCKYACKNRVGDITLGDFWGVLNEMPEIFKGENALNLKDGVSAVIVNTEKGEKALNDLQNSLKLFETSFEAVEKKNDKLSHPTSCPQIRETAMKIFSKNGYEAVDIWWKKRNKKALMIRRVTNRMPAGLRQRLSKLK